MDDKTTPTSAWLAFSLAFDASARHCQHLRQESKSPRDIGKLISDYQNGNTQATITAFKGDLSQIQLKGLKTAKTQQKIDEAIAWEQSNPQHHLIGFDHPRYPSLLHDTAYAPPLLYAKGDLAALDYPALAIVGSRKASRQAIDTAQMLAYQMAERGVAIVSGLAMGIDAAAHEGALKACGRTIVVAATEPQSVYPKRHADLAKRIIDQNGLILTEYPLGAPTLRWHFPKRNRIISGLSLGVLIVEAGLPSGTLTTATHAMDQGREVMAIPGSIHNSQAKGCHALIKQGASLVESDEDIVDALAWPLSRALENRVINTNAPNATDTDKSSKTAEERQILRALEANSATVDELMTHVDCPVAQLSMLLSLLEIDGEIKACAGGRYTRC